MIDPDGLGPIKLDCRTQRGTCDKPMLCCFVGACIDELGKEIGKNMSDWNKIDSQALDNHITGHYGEDQNKALPTLEERLTAMRHIQYLSAIECQIPDYARGLVDVAFKCTFINDTTDEIAEFFICYEHAPETDSLYGSPMRSQAIGPVIQNAIDVDAAPTLKDWCTSQGIRVSPNARRLFNEAVIQRDNLKRLLDDDAAYNDLLHNTDLEY